MKLARTVSLTLALSLALGSWVSAHTHAGSGSDAPEASIWARQEVEQAARWGLTVSNAAYPAPVTLEECARLLLQYLAAQNHCDVESFCALLRLYRQEVKESAALDGSSFGYCRALGLLNALDVEEPAPQRELTRQEVSALLLAAYALCGGEYAGEQAPPFRDAADIAPWAAEGVSALAGWKVVRGIDGNFAPEALCPVEECVVLLARLYDSAPVSRERSNVTALFSYTQCLSYVDSLTAREGETAGFAKTMQLEGPKAALVRLDFGGVTLRHSNFFLVHREGGVRRVDLGLCSTAQGTVSPALVLEAPQFSEDGAVFTCAVILDEDVYAAFGGELLHEKGVYTISIDVEGPAVGQVRKG